jgi:hypothetical protein
MITLEPIFRSDSNIDQLVEIIKVIGTPSYDEIMEMNPDCDIEKYQFPKINPRPWEKVQLILFRSSKRRITDRSSTISCIR